ncbi:MAG: hypothetical protein JW828_13995 [Sedimentisphaerales bacterium]|nr:hypothetical protein [Sedimentisphaerales bacterium]
MRTRRNKGFVLFILLGILPLLALAMVILLTMERTMAHESTTALLEARARNLACSASAWLLYNTPEPEDLAIPTESDLSQLCLANDRLQIEILGSSSDHKRYRIIAECSRGRMTVRRTTILTLPSDDKPPSEQTEERSNKA